MKAIILWLFWLSIVTATSEEYIESIQDCLWCLDDNPKNRHKFCQKDNGYPQCQPAILYLDYFCPVPADNIPDREQCFNIIDYNNECKQCAQRSHFYCKENDRCYSQKVFPEVRNYCGFFVMSYPFCGDEDPSNGCQQKKTNVVNDEYWSLATANNANEIDVEIQVDAERYCAVYFKNELTDYTQRTLLAIVF